MTGIENILNKIDSLSALECETILSAAQRDASKILSDAKFEAARKESQIELECDNKCEAIKKRSESLSNLEEKQIMLKYKQAAISQMIQTGITYLKSLPDDEYFDLIYKMIKKNSSPNSGEIFFNSKDLSRLPSDFLKKANEISKGELTLSDKAISIDSGFVLKYSDIEQNCSFEAIALSSLEQISDQVSHLLFR